MLTFKQYLEERKSEMEVLKKNRTTLSDEEREMCKKKKATWSNGDVAVWKSKRTNGDDVFVTSTHRAYKTANNIGDAINHFHNGIKQTA